MKAFLEEFKKFALRGNVMDMAVGGICAFPHNQSNEQNIITWRKGRGSKTYYQGMSVL